MRMRLVVALGIAGAGWVAVRWINGQVGPSHPLGVRDGKLADCPDRPNCVSSTAARPEQRLPPLALREAPEDAVAKLSAIIRSMPRSRIVSADQRYLHAEFRSWTFGFRDDVEFLIDGSAAEIHFRAAARLGYSDLGVNRRRMEEIRRRYAARE